jgi:hypothetical protein
MTIIRRSIAALACLVATSVTAQAQPAEDSAAAATPAPIPTLHCEFKTVNECLPDGTCKGGKDLAGMPLPLKVTVDFENTVVSAVDQTGFARTDKFDAAADSSEAASIAFNSADASLTGFGTCTSK